MPKYEVVCWRVMYQSIAVEVEAEGRIKARRLALDKACDIDVWDDEYPAKEEVIEVNDLEE